jgi:hypothetical protein
MRVRRLVPVLLIGLLSLVPAVRPVSAAEGAGKSRARVLAGMASAPAGQPLEGVVVTAGRPGPTVTVSVITQADGCYSFPAGKLVPGRYFLSIRAAGYELDGDGAAQAGVKDATANLKLKPARDLAAQLINAEWILSFPGTSSSASGRRRSRSGPAAITMRRW